MTDVKINSATLDLLQIIEEHTDYSYTGKRELKRKVLDWTGKWLVVITTEQAVHNPSIMSLEALDQIKYHTLSRMADQIAEECAIFHISKNKVSASMLALKRKP